MKPNILPFSNSPSILLRAPRLRMLIRMARKLSGLRCKRMARLTTGSLLWISHWETDFSDRKGAGSGHADITCFRAGLRPDPAARRGSRGGLGGGAADGGQCDGRGCRLGTGRARPRTGAGAA